METISGEGESAKSARIYRGTYGFRRVYGLGEYKFNVRTEGKDYETIIYRRKAYRTNRGKELKVIKS